MKKLNILEKKIKRNEGFTLIEALIAILIFAVAGTAIMQMQIKSIQGTGIAAGITEGSFVHSAEIERLLLLDYDDSSLNQNTYTNTVTGSVQFANAYTVVNTPIAGTTGEQFKMLTVTTTWQKGARQHRISSQAIKLPE